MSSIVRRSLRLNNEEFALSNEDYLLNKRYEDLNKYEPVSIFPFTAIPGDVKLITDQDLLDLLKTLREIGDE